MLVFLDYFIIYTPIFACYSGGFVDSACFDLLKKQYWKEHLHCLSNAQAFILKKIKPTFIDSILLLVFVLLLLYNQIYTDD